MAVRSTLPTHSASDIREILRGLPTATGYRVTVKPLRYRTAPHLQAFTFWDEPEMVLQVPEPFRPFRELVDLGADGTPLVFFRTRRDVIRFLYLHEFCHWWLYLTHGWGSSAEIACDRYAFANYRPRARRSAQMRGRPGIARVGRGVGRRGGALAGRPAELTRVALLADALLARALGPASRSTTAPPGATATAVGTRATPYLRASSGRRDTSTGTTIRPAARSSFSCVRQSVHRGCVN